MKSLSSVGLGLSVVFGCLLLALVAEVYYLLWWKKRITTRDNIRNDYSSPVKELFYMFCWKRPSSSSSLRHTQEHYSSVRISEALVHHEQGGQVHQTHNSKDFLFKPFGEDHQQDLFVPPRFLFTIVEETKEDLESEEGKSRGKSLSDLLFVETPYLTPMASPSLFTPPLTPIMNSYNHRGGFNPLFESSTDAEFNRIKSSPPPKFKFLQDAEEKLKRKLVQEEGNEGNGNGNEANGSLITVVIDK
ncbi:putative transmembrane protein [Senna tora]|uniref:Putative transmembrane protein n=1 Tax=Senna tora TaxID=362788 RepID=A0A834SX40_9FABA|nr:putative transmembrane protein [Senna tora]